MNSFAALAFTRSDNLTRVLLLAVGLLIAGCQSQVSTSTADTVAIVVRPITKNAVNLVLAKNPAYADALLAVASGTEAALGVSELTPQGIKAFVDGVALKYALDNETKVIIASAIDDLVKTYQDATGTTVIAPADPNVRKYLLAFAKGIREGVEFHKAITS